MAVKVPSSGPASARILVVGEAPGREEERDGTPFIGPSGKLLRDCLQSIGLDPSLVRFSNLCQERPPNNELRAFFDPAGRPNPTVREGLTALHEEIESVNPDLIIPLGNFPLRFLTGRGSWGTNGPTGIGDYRGYLLPGSDFAGGRKCLPTYHPAAALRQYPLKHILRTDLAKALRLSGPGPVQYPRKAIVVDPDGPDRDAWASWLVSPPGTISPPARPSQWDSATNTVQGYASDTTFTVASGGFLSADIEYIGSKLLCVGFTRHSDVSVVYSTPSRASVSFVRDILLGGVPLCFQNGMFDCSILEWFYEIDAVKYLRHDTMYMMHAAYIEMQKDLGFIGSLFTDLPPWWQNVNAAFWKEVRDGKRPIFDVLPYNGFDVCATHEAAESLLANELADPDTLRTYTHEMSLVRPLWQTAKRGVRVDTTRLAALREQLDRESQLYLHGITRYNDNVPVNVKSPPQVATFIYGKMGLPQIGPKTPKGRWKMDDATLATLQLRAKDERQRTAIRMVREARERLDLISKFCEIELDDDGRLRCHYDPAKTTTGRLSSRKFYPTNRGANLQNVPRDPRVRAVFVPDPGYIFGYADLKSAESLVVAHITGDREMLRLHSPEYMSGELDGHKYVASFLLDKPIDKITKDERYLGKRVRHAGNYGLSWAKLQLMVNADAQETGVSIDAAQAKALINRYRQFHPGLQAWWNDTQAELWRTHTLYSLHKRRRVFYDRPDAILPEAIAYVPQSTVADTLNLGLLNIYASEHLRDLGFELLLQVHDAVGFQISEKSAETALGLLPRLMHIPLSIQRRGIEPYSISIPVEIQVGYNWGEFDPKNPTENPNGLKSWKVPK